MLDVSLPEFFLLCGSGLLAVLWLSEIFDWPNIFSPFEAQLPSSVFGAPDAWKILYHEGRSEKESPINIMTRAAVVIQHSVPLKWSGHDMRPVDMTMANDGNTVKIQGFWLDDFKPTLTGGPLIETYDFHSMTFHWGPSDEGGSEHTIDGTSYPLEMQMIYVKPEFNSPYDAIVAGAKLGVAIVSIPFQIITNEDNQFLDYVVEHLCRAPRPGMKISIPPFPLDAMFSPFEKRYYSYCGSVMESPSNEVVNWLIQPYPMKVSSSQMKKFRSIYSVNIPIFSYSKQIQRLNERDLYCHE